MFVVTMTKKKALRAIFIAVAVLVGIAIVIYAVLSAINAHADSGKVPIYCVARNDKKIAITFDVAWENSNTEQLIEILEKEGVKATFFVTGDFCDRYPEDVLKFFTAGHEIQNHSDTHPHVKGMNVNDLIADTKEASRKIEMITNVKPTLYRTPYGEYDNVSLTALEGLGMKVIQWDVDSIDWKEVSAEQIQKRILEKTQAGSILLFHNDLANTTEALPDLLKSLKEKGYSFVPVSELIYQKDYTIDHTGKQISSDPAEASNVLTFIDKEKANQVLSSENADRVIEIAKKYLTAEEILALKDGVTTEILLELLDKMSEEDRAEIEQYIYDAESVDSADEDPLSSTSPQKDAPATTAQNGGPAVTTLPQKDAPIATTAPATTVAETLPETAAETTAP